MFSRIDEIQNEIDKLNSLCADSFAADTEQDEGGLTLRRRERLGIFILKLLDGVLEQRYVSRLEKWLLSDAAARLYYVDFIRLTALLSFYYNPVRYKPTIPGELQKR